MWLQLRNNNHTHAYNYTLTLTHTQLANVTDEVIKYWRHVLCPAINRYKPDQIGRVKYAFFFVFLASRLTADKKVPLC